MNISGNSILKPRFQILEELHFHAKNEHRYIKNERMKEIGFESLDKEVVHLKMKKRFIESDLYTSGIFVTRS